MVGGTNFVKTVQYEIVFVNIRPNYSYSSILNAPKGRLSCLAPRAGFEPATNRLTVDCSTAELPRKEEKMVLFSLNVLDIGIYRLPKQMLCYLLLVAK